METNETPQAQTAKARYEQLKLTREPYLRRARECAEVTIPALCPPEGTQGDDLTKPFQSVGAQGVNNLAGKLLVALFPPGASFFRLDLDQFLLRKLIAESGADGENDTRADIEKAFGEMERAVSARVEQNGSRAPLFESLKRLLVGGNVLVEIGEGGRIRVVPLENYVIKRDPEGTPLEIISLQKLSRLALPPRVKDIVDSIDQSADSASPNDKESPVELYTRIVRQGKRWRVVQEVMGKPVDKSQGTYPLDKSPWLALRYSSIAGEDYGRSFCDEMLGDLLSFESLSQSIIELTAVVAKILSFVDESGVTSRDEIARAPNGAVLSGRAADITFLMVDKAQDLTVAKSTADGIQERLATAFLLLSGVQRDAERVTAEEIRMVAAELEQALGGVYSLLAEEFQLPLVRRLIQIMEKEKALPIMPTGVITPKIITGLAALGRGSDRQKLDDLLVGISELFGPEAVAKWVNIGAYIKRRGTSLGMDTEGLIRSDAQVSEMDAQAQQQEAAMAMAPDAAKRVAEGEQSPSA